MININKKYPIIGIYKITSPSGKIYIGQSINIQNTRYRRYELIHCKQQPKIYNSLIKYGFEAHDFDIIQECPINELNQWETHWKIYYLSQVQGNWQQVLFCDLYDKGMGPRSEETKRKIGLANKGRKFPGRASNQSIETRNKRSKSTKGKSKPPEFGINHSLKMKGVKKSEEHKDKISKAKKGQIYNIDKNKINGHKNKPKDIRFIKSISRPIIQYDLNMNPIREWFGITEAGKYFKGDIHSCCKGRQKTAGGYIWKYKGDDPMLTYASDSVVKN